MLAEYREAGETCRASASLMRNGLAFFATLQAVVFGFLESADSSSLPVILLEVFGLVVSIITAATMWRLGTRYTHYMQRARYLERSLGMHLYEYSRLLTGQGLGNHRLLLAIPGVAAILYVVLLADAAGVACTIK